MEDLQKQIYEQIQQKNTQTTIELAETLKQQIVDVVSQVKALEAQDVLQTELVKETKLVLTQEGTDASINGTVEYRIYKALAGSKMHKSELIKLIGNDIVQNGLPGALRRKLVKIISKEKGDPDPEIEPLGEQANDSIQEQLLNLAKLNDKDIQALKKSKLIKNEEVKYFIVKKGDKFSNGLEKQQAELTIDDLQKDTDPVLKPLNFNAKGKPIQAGQLHPLFKLRSQFAHILTCMGFQQMPTNKYIESSFWNFDALFQPQQHPARDVQDTFYVGGDLSLSNLDKIDKTYFKAVKETHEHGGFGSIGYSYVWDENEARKQILRTHTTAVSARVLYQHAQKCKKEGFKPLKVFSIDKVFRNETLDATHLCEFHQVEGVVLEKGIGIAHLMGVIKTFFSCIGMDQIKFKPCYNPYTEPSMEIFCYHPGLKKWIEVGNSGVFRPEMLRPMGFDEDVVAVAWGLGLERPAFIQMGFNNIRDLVGHQCDLLALGKAEDIILTSYNKTF